MDYLQTFCAETRTRITSRTERLDHQIFKNERYNVQTEDWISGEEEIGPQKKIVGGERTYRRDMHGKSAPAVRSRISKRNAVGNEIQPKTQFDRSDCQLERNEKFISKNGDMDQKSTTEKFRVTKESTNDVDRKSAPPIRSQLHSTRLRSGNSTKTPNRSALETLTYGTAAIDSMMLPPIRGNIIKSQRSNPPKTFGDWTESQLKTYSHRNYYESSQKHVGRTPRPVFTDDPLKILLVGGVGTGKSSTGNSLLRKRAFKTGFSASSVTRSYKSEKEGNITVVDTVGYTSDFFKKSLLLNAFDEASPGPNAILHILSVTERFSHELFSSIEQFVNLVGKEVYDFTVLVFTHEDELRKWDVSIEKFITSSPPELRNLVERCQNRYITIDNTTSKKEKTVGKLLKIVKDIKKERNCFETYDTFCF